MLRVFEDTPQVLSRTLEIAERCNLRLEKVPSPFPHFDVPDGYTLDSYFEHITRQGFARRMENLRNAASAGRLKHSLAEYEQRLAREIGIIQQMKFSGYFLIVWDFIRYARECGIPVGPGRGSAAGAVVAYSLGITDIDPLQHELLFERFLNPERISMPDIDIDFCMNRRGEVIEYVTHKYGRENVAQIITFGTMAAKAAIKDVGRAMDMPYADVDRIAKMVPTTLNIKLDDALTESAALQEAYQKDPQVRQLLDTARKLEGLVRNSGVHAAGVVISPRPLIELVPLHKTKNDEIVTAFDMVAIEKMGLLKMDFLGLTTLTILDDTLKLLAQAGKHLALDDIPLEDEETYQRVFHRGLTSGVFQFESHGMRDVLRRYQPNSIEHLTALNALYRPGPMAMIDDFIERKHGRRKIEYELPELKEILEETLGVFVYQEQVMQAANKLAGYSLGEADLLRRAMGKKKQEEMAGQRERFIQGAAQRKLPPKKIEKIFDLMAQFAGYGFNKSHSAAYALLAYHTAYLKTHYPVEFMAALLSSEISKPENVVKYIKECREMGISVEPPDVQISGANFTPSATGIRFGLTAIKNVGRNAIDSIIAVREQNGGFPNLWEFCEKVDLRLMNKRVLESLIKAGALDAFGRRAQLMAVSDRAMERAQQAQRDLVAGQHGLFAGLSALFETGTNGHKSVDDLPNTPDWDENERLQAEKEVLGFFVSGHPLDKYAEKLRNLNVVDTATALEMKAPPPARRRNGGGEPENLLAIAGVIVGLKVGKSKRSGEMYAQASLEDTVGKIDIICFPKDYSRLCESLKIEVPVLVKGVLRADDDESAPKLSVSSVQPLEDIRIKLPQNVRIRVLLEGASEAMLGSLRAMITAAPGPGRLMINLESRGEYCVMLEPEGLTVAADRGFIERAEQLLGQGAVQAFE